MIKKIRESFSLKVFLLTCIILIFSNVILLVSIYHLMPQLYTQGMGNRLEKAGKELEVALTGKTIEEAGNIINEFCKTNDTLAAVYDENGNHVRVSGVEKQFELVDDGEATVTFMEFGTYTQSQNYSYMVRANLADRSGYFVALSSMEQEKIELLLEDIGKILPFVISIIFVLSFVMSIIYTRFVASPILKVAAAAEAMAEMKWEDAEITLKRKDEIGTLVKNINHTSAKLKKASEERNSFFAAASHELKTPLTILIGQLTGMLYNVGVYSDRERYLQKALNTTTEMEKRVLNILEVSRLENANIVVHKQEIDISLIVKEQIAAYEDIMNDKQMKLQVDIPQNMYVLGDKNLMAKAIENVLQNAVKYSPPGSQIRCHSYKQENTWVLAIENTGVHLVEGKERDLFEPFYRLEESRNQKTGGSGLGLYIVKRALELQNFNCFIRNTAEGVTFEINF